MQSEEPTREATETSAEPSPRATRTGRVLARVGAASVAVGFLIFSMVRASSTGCASTPQSEVESPDSPAAPEAAGAQGSGGAAGKAGAKDDPDKHYFPGSKAPSHPPSRKP